MAPRLADYLTAIETTRPAHCGAFLCGWVEQVTGAHPAPWADDLTTTEWARLLSAHGGLARVLDAYAKRLGHPRAVEPTAGDVGVVMAPTHVTRIRPRQTCAIRTGKGWAMWSNTRGLSVVDFPTVKAWRLLNA